MPALGPHDLTTGVREIDAYTEGLCFLMERIFDPLVECRRREGACDHSHCTRIDAIMKYMARGFDRQNRLMAEAAYPGQIEHRRDHDALVAQLRSMQTAHLCAERDSNVVREVVTAWAVGHNSHCDSPLGKWAVTRRVVEPASLQP
jgi:hemerythrin-like metal-binding protein